MERNTVPLESELRARIEELESRLEEAEEVLRALKSQEVDALIVDSPDGEQVFTLKGAEHPYRVLFETMGEGAVTVGSDETILYCNHRFAEILNKPLERVMGMPFSAFVPPHDLLLLKKLWDDGDSVSREMTLQAADGTEVPVQISMRRALIDDREVICMVATDLTRQKEAYAQLENEIEERKRVERELRQAHKMEAMGTLAGGIAHDFNNILAAIIGFANMSIDGAPVGSSLQRNAERIFEAGLRGRELVKQILTFARQAEAERKPLQLSGVIEEITKLLRASIPTTVDLRFTVTAQSDSVLADPAQIQQVVMNLCTNAAHAMQEKGVITIELSECSFEAASKAPVSTMGPGSYVTLSISDTGHGIAPDTVNRIFDPFFTTKKPGEGTGLGLSVVHGIVESHGGAITVHSEPGKGAIFTIYLPKLAQEAWIAAETGERAIQGGHERILFIDDEEAIAEMAEALLQDLGYKVTAKTNPREALALLKLRPDAYDCVVTDQTMPELTGLELAREIIALRRDMPIILCTGFSHLVNDNVVKAEGIKAFVMKPLTKKEIGQTLRKVLDDSWD